MSVVRIDDCDLPSAVLLFPLGGLYTLHGMQEAYPHLNIDSLYQDLLHTDLFIVYRSAFERVTGQTLSLIHPDIISTPEDEANRCVNDFCATLMESPACKHSCTQHSIDLSKRIDNQALSIRCEGNITTTLIPIKAGRQTVAFLRSGKVKTNDQPLDASFIKNLQENLPPQVAKNIIKNFDRLTTLTKEEYHSQLTLLGAFALQLSDLANHLCNKQSLPPSQGIVESTKRYIHEKLAEKIELNALASHVNVTSSYLCKQFKKSTGLTIVEYINRHRIEKAKQLLSSKDTRIIEIAYETGFQSLSQFNRSFQRYAGQSPSDYKAHKSTALSS